MYGSTSDLRDYTIKSRLKGSPVRSISLGQLMTFSWFSLLHSSAHAQAHLFMEASEGRKE